MRMMNLDNERFSADFDTLGSDGRVVHLRDLLPGDLPVLADLDARASDESVRLRFFGAGRAATAAWEERALTPHPGRYTVGAFREGILVGCGSYEVLDEQPDAAEFALLVADPVQHSGIGTLLLEQLVAHARGHGFHRLVGEVLVANTAMLEVIRDLGLPVTTSIEPGSMHAELDLSVGDEVVDAICERERAAAAESLRPLLAPRSVVIVGAGHRPGTVGHEVLRNVLAGWFPGGVYAVNPRRDDVLGVHCYPNVRDLPEAPDLAIIALPARFVEEAVIDCGLRGVRAAVLLGAGFGEAGAEGAALQDRVLTAAREAGIRLVGPNCIGIANTDPRVSLNATFAALQLQSGSVALLAQSGAFGVGMLGALNQVDDGIAQFVSIGNKIDVGGNDLLLAWEGDERIRVVGAYLESVGDPRRFARIASRVSRRKPVLVVKSGRTDVGRRAGQSHTAAAATSEVALEALFRSSRVLRLGSMRELLDASRVLATTPPPRGPYVAIVGNSGGPEILAADAASDAGLSVPAFAEQTRRALAELGLPDQNPLDLGAAVTPEQAQAALEIVAACPKVDAVITVFTDVAITDAQAMGDAIRAAALDAVTGTADGTGIGKPVLAVTVGAAASAQQLPGTNWQLPVFCFPEDAAAALGVAWRYAQLRARPPRLPRRPAGVDADTARTLVDRALDSGEGWLPAEDAFALLAAYGVPVAGCAVVADEEAAVVAARTVGYPLAAKIATPGAHKTDAGGVRLDLADEAALRAAVRDLLPLDDRVLLQRMAAPGTELIVGSVHDPQCGPLVMLGAGGVLTDILGDRQFALAPLGDEDADDLIAGLRSAVLLDGFRGAPVVDRAAVRDVLVRIAALVDDIPEIAELDVNPLIATADGLVAVDARVRLAPPPTTPDPLVRQLRGPRSANHGSAHHEAPQEARHD
jgi:acyl-CoA synthetase (NDP forming)/GNAT superfamily N-acetyltransferase